MTKIKSIGYGASGSLIGGKTLEPYKFERDEPKENEVLIDVLYCGVCHSDVHQVANDWKNTIYPCVPGHEVVGRVVSVGGAVTKFSAGDLVGVGCMVNSCQHCEPCHDNEEQFCEGPVGQTMTYNGYWKPDGLGYNTFGGYSDNIVANEKFVMKIPEGLEVSAVAPLLCAGITTYSPLKHWGVTAGHTVGIVGIGGLGHVGVKIAKAMGAKVIAITTKDDKRNDALALGADDVLISTDEKAMESYADKIDFILVTIPEVFDVNDYISLIKRRGALVTVGLLGPYDAPTNNMEVAKRCATVGGSLIGGTAETQEMLDFCAEHNILPEVEIIDIKDINDAFKKLKDEEVRFRYVIDMATLKSNTELA